MKNRKEQGITLIALIITIIVLLILAGVTINLTIGENGIFKTAQLAAKNYTNAQEKELADLAEFNNTLKDTIKGQTQEEKVQLITAIALNKTETNIGIGLTESLTAIITPTNATNKNLTWTSSNESVATVSEGTITAIAEGTTTITATTKDGSGKSASCNVTVKPTLASKAQPGDYVEYDGGNGYTGKWQVLYNDSTYGLQIISSDTVTDTFTLGGSTEAEAKASYNSAVDTLNTECRKYVNSAYATSGRCVGSNPEMPDDLENMETVKYFWNNEDSGCKIGDENYKIDLNAMNEVGIKQIPSNKSYWLASRSVNSFTSAIGPVPQGVYFRVAYALDSGSSTTELWVSLKDGTFSFSRSSFGIRPVITLKSTIRTSEGNGSNENPFKLIAQ